MRVRSVSSTRMQAASSRSQQYTVPSSASARFASSYVTSVLIVRLTYVHLQGPSTSNFTKRA